jgi:hypothetical protein
MDTLHGFLETSRVSVGMFELKGLEIIFKCHMPFFSNVPKNLIFSVWNFSKVENLFAGFLPSLFLLRTS